MRSFERNNAFTAHVPRLLRSVVRYELIHVARFQMAIRFQMLAVRTVGQWLVALRSNAGNFAFEETFQPHCPVLYKRHGFVSCSSRLRSSAETVQKTQLPQSDLRRFYLHMLGPFNTHFPSRVRIWNKRG
jgi:hypothetical protein